MPAPTAGALRSVAFDSTSPKTTASFAVSAGDVLVAYAVSEGPQEPQMDVTDSQGLTWTHRQEVNVSGYCRVRLSTASASSAGNMTVTFTENVASVYWSRCGVLPFTGSGGVGASAKANSASGTPSVVVTTTAANSAIVVVVGDFAAVDGASRTWRTTAGAITELEYTRDAVRATVHSAYHPDAGVVAAETVGMTVPTSQVWSVAAVEILGQVGPWVPEKRMVVQAVNRAANY